MYYEIFISLCALAITLGFAYKRFKNKNTPEQTFGTDLKMVMVVRSDLKMGHGKIAAQCCHACLGLYKSQLKKDIPRLKAWENSNYKKVVLKCANEEEMINIADKARSQNLDYYIVRDAGLTQIAPGSKTVLSVGPASEKELKDVTGYLKLL